jgi:hypothetical protein
MWEPVALMIREKFKRGPARTRVPKRGAGADYSIVAKMAGNTVGAKGVNYQVVIMKQPSDWED